MKTSWCCSRNAARCQGNDLTGRQNAAVAWSHYHGGRVPYLLTYY